jgi:hypothetical protein
MLAIPRFGSVALAKERLTAWLADGKLPWNCMAWDGLDAEGLARLDLGPLVMLPPSGAYSPGDPKFWGCNALQIDWLDSSARESGLVAYGAQARGIRVLRTALLDLLPLGEPELEPMRGAAAWIATELDRMKSAGEIPPDIRISELARMLEHRMKRAAAGTSLRPLKSKSIENALHDWGFWPIK